MAYRGGVDVVEVGSGAKAPELLGRVMARLKPCHNRGGVMNRHPVRHWLCYCASMFVPILIFVLGTGQDAGHPMTGDELVQACRASVRILNGEGREGDTLNAHFCASFVEGFISGLHVSDDKVCVRSEDNRATLVKVYVAYMDKNPRLLDSTADVGLYLALKEGYPCAAKSK